MRTTLMIIAIVCFMQNDSLKIIRYDVNTFITKTAGVLDQCSERQLRSRQSALTVCLLKAAITWLDCQSLIKPSDLIVLLAIKKVKKPVLNKTGFTLSYYLYSPRLLSMISIVPTYIKSILMTTGLQNHLLQFSIYHNLLSWASMLPNLNLKWYLRMSQTNLSINNKFVICKGVNNTKFVCCRYSHPGSLFYI